MELILERFRKTKDYTLSRLYDAKGRRFFTLDVLEPPISGLTASKLTAICPGRYRLFLKPDRETQEMTICLQKLTRQSRCGFAEPLEPIDVKGQDFRSPNKVFNQALWCGRFNPKTLKLEPLHEDFQRVIMRVVIAKQARENINLIIK